MLSDSMHSSYAQYKADTDFVASWLAATARQCGYIPDKAAPASAPGAGRLKGKARKQAREASNTASAEGQSRLQKTIVRVKEFVPLAECVVQWSKPRVQVPASIAAMLQRAIKQRKVHNDLHQSKVGPGISDSNDSHNYFIGVLEQVQDILRPNMVVNPSSSSSTGPDTNSRGSDVTNAFAPLNVHEPTDHPESSQEEKSIPYTHRVDAANDPELRSDEAFFARVCLFEDVHKILAVLRRLWENYRTGKMDLVAVSIASNTGIDFVRSLQEEFESSFPGQQQLTGEICLFCLYERVTKTQQSRNNQEGESCLQSAHKVMDAYVKHRVREDDFMCYVPVVNMRDRGIYESVVNSSALNSQDGDYWDFKLFMGVIPEYEMLLMNNGTGYQAEHEILRGLRRVIQEKRPIFWVTFAFQVFLDIRHILRKKVGRGFADLATGANTITRDIAQVLEFHDQAGLDYGKDADRALRQVLKLIDLWVEQDFFGNLRRRLHQNENDSISLPEHYLLERDPLWCGLLLYNFRVVAYEGAIFNANCSGSVLAVAHLYNCLRQSQLLPIQWTNMEKLFNAQGIDHLFIGGLPSSVEDCAKRLSLAIGLPISLFARNSRRLPTKPSQRQVRKLTAQAPVSWFFKHRYCDSSRRVDTRPADVDRAIQQGQQAEDGQHAAPSPRIIWALLIQLASALHAEIPELTFEYFQLHLTCWTILRAMEQSLGPRLEDYTELIRHPREMPAIVLWILTEPIKAPLSGPQVQLQVLQDVAKIVENILTSKDGLLQPSNSS